MLLPDSIINFDVIQKIVIISTMDGLNVGKILAGLRNPELYLRRLREGDIRLSGNDFNTFNSSLSNKKPSIAAPSAQLTQALSNQLQMNQIAAMDRSVYIKNLLGLPQTLGEILLAAQNKNNPINTLLLNDSAQELIKNQKVLAQIFGDQSEVTLNIQNIQTQNVQNIQKDAVMLFFSGMIQMPAISEMILKNGKHAVAELIAAMATASKNGMTGDQIRETLSVINSCISLAESGNPNQTLKSLMMLYLPWLPLNEGVGFDFEVETNSGENESNDSRLTVLIQTRNFGNVKGVFTLTTTNSVDIYIICSEDFPKRTLQKSLMEESASHAMNSTIDVEAVEPKNKDKNENREAKVNLSATNEMNPYLLLMAHAFIRNTIFIDSNGIVEENETTS